MRRPLKLTLFLIVPLAGITLFVAMKKRDHGDAGFTKVEIKSGDLTRKALATGQIVPRQEIQVKSQISGTVRECYVEVGDTVKAGQPLFAISPAPTPMEKTEAERAVQLRRIALEQAEAEWKRSESLDRQGVLPRGELDRLRRNRDSARVELAQAQDKLGLMSSGRIAGGADSVIRAPASGTVLQRLVNPGDPVVPLTSFQAGTPLMSIADMGGLIFKGTVDEIDVGKLQAGLPVRIQLGAVSDSALEGKLTRIAPQAKIQDGSTLFDVEASVTPKAGTTLRAGYSANADVIIEEHKNVVLVPERLVTFEGDKAFVEVPGPAGQPPARREIRAGLSDGMNVEVVSGLKAGDQVIERPPKKVE